MKIHMGCGSVYLREYINVDVPSSRTFLASERPDLVRQWITTDDDYYGRHADKTVESLSHGPLNQEYVCDRYGSFFFIPCYGPIRELLARHSFEHLSQSEAREALYTIRRMMKPGAILRLDVPDHKATLKEYRETEVEQHLKFYERHLFGPQRGDYGYHIMSYTPERLTNLVRDHGFIYEGAEKNIHIYPAFCLRFMAV